VIFLAWGSITKKKKDEVTRFEVQDAWLSYPLAACYMVSWTSNRLSGWIYLKECCLSIAETVFRNRQWMISISTTLSVA